MSTYGAAEMAAAFRTVRANTIQIAEEIPADKYDFEPAPGTRSVRRLLAHIAVSTRLHEDIHRVKHVSTLQGYDFTGVLAEAAAVEEKPRTKEDLLGFLGSEGEKFATWLGSLTPAFLAETYTDPMGQNPKTRLEGLLSAKEHEMHHRGQLMLVQRLLGQVPHLTRQLNDRRAARAAAAASAAAASAAAAAAG